MTNNECTIKDSYALAEEIGGQYSEFFIETYLTRLLTFALTHFLKILKEGSSKIEFKKILSLATKETYFIFNGKLYEQVDGVAMGSPLCLKLAHVFLVYFDFSTFYYRQFVNDIFVLFTSPEHLETFRNFLIG